MKPNFMHDSWFEKLKPLFQNGVMETIRTSLHPDITPHPKYIFRAFEMPPEQVEVCIMGLSPYPNINDACGIAFALEDRLERDYNMIPYSLQILEDAIAKETYDIAYETKNLLHNWTEQNILLLNAALTALPYQPTAYVEVWRPFTTEVVKILDENRIIFYLLGNDARKYKDVIKYSTVFESIHPAAMAYNKDMVFDSKFKQVSECYEKMHGKPIIW